MCKSLKKKACMTKDKVSQKQTISNQMKFEMIKCWQNTTAACGLLITNGWMRVRPQKKKKIKR